MATQQMLIMFDTKANCNKFYHAKLLDDGETVEVRYGRVGNDGVKHTYTGGQRKYDQLLRQKRNKGYKDALIAADVDDGGVTVTSNVIDTALEEIKYLDDMSRALVTTISQKNIHRITATTSIKFDSGDGLFKTPLGVIQQHGVEEAMRLLDQIEESVKELLGMGWDGSTSVEKPKPKSKKRKRDEVEEEEEVKEEVSEGTAEVKDETSAEVKEETPVNEVQNGQDEDTPEPAKRRRTGRTRVTKAQREAEEAAKREAEEKKRKEEEAYKKEQKRLAEEKKKAEESKPEPQMSPEMKQIMDTLYGLNERYFVIIPSKVKNARDTSHLLFNSEAIETQRGICDALLETLELIEDLKKKAAEEVASKGKKKKSDEEKIFDVEVKHVTDKRTFNRINKMFETSKNEIHGYTAKCAKVKNMYKIKLGSQQAPFAATSKKIKCVQELWHGTRLQNILSILGKGLLLPKLSPGQKVGAMFGDGLYFANQSSKSLNYCDGMLWTSDGSGKPETVYMFLASVALGKYFTPEGPVCSNPPEGYDSYWAKAGESGVMNDEIIVFDASQIRLDYLLEIELRDKTEE